MINNPAADIAACLRHLRSMDVQPTEITMSAPVFKRLLMLGLKHKPGGNAHQRRTKARAYARFRAKFIDNPAPVCFARYIGPAPRIAKSSISAEPIET